MYNSYKKNTSKMNVNLPKTRNKHEDILEYIKKESNI